MFGLTDTQLVLLAFEPLCVNMNKFASSRGQTSTEALLLFFPKPQCSETFPEEILSQTEF